jgi:hypothetical protein
LGKAYYAKKDYAKAQETAVTALNIEPKNQVLLSLCTIFPLILLVEIS